MKIIFTKQLFHDSSFFLYNCTTFLIVRQALFIRRFFFIKIRNNLNLSWIILIKIVTQFLKQIEMGRGGGGWRWMSNGRYPAIYINNCMQYLFTECKKHYAITHILFSDSVRLLFWVTSLNITVTVTLVHLISCMTPQHPV